MQMWVTLNCVFTKIGTVYNIRNSSILENKLAKTGSAKQSRSMRVSTSSKSARQKHSHEQKIHFSALKNRGNKNKDRSELVLSL